MDAIHIEQAAKTLDKSLRSESGYLGIGIGEVNGIDVIIVYLATDASGGRVDRLKDGVNGFQIVERRIG